MRPREEPSVCVSVCLHVCLCKHMNVYLCFEYVHIRWGHVSRQSISPNVPSPPKAQIPSLRGLLFLLGRPLP